MMTMWARVLLLISAILFCPADSLFSEITTRDLAHRLLGSANESPVRWELLPKKVNLRSEIVALRVNFVRQGMRNACGAFAATSMLEMQARRLGYDIDLSEQYLLWATKEEGADPERGLSIEELARGLREHRICREELMPYKSITKIIDPTPAAIKNASGMPPVRLERVVRYDGVPGFSDAELYMICRALARYEPVCLSSYWTDDQSILDKDFVMREGNMKVAHMVLLTGYELGDDGEGYLLLRNSWGMGWGDFGYAKMPFKLARRHGIDAVRFTFDFPAQDTADLASSANSSQESTLPAAPAGLISYFLILAGVNLLAGVVGFGLPTLLVARNRKLPLQLILYCFLLLPLIIVLGLVFRHLVVHYLISDWQMTGILVACAVLLIIIWLRLTMRRFQVGASKAMLIVLVGVVIGWSLRVYAENSLTNKAFQEWRRVFGPTPVHQQALFVLMDESQRSEQIAGVKVAAVNSNYSLDGEREWLKRWRAGLAKEKRVMHGDNELVKEFFARRVAAYNDQLMRLEKLDIKIEP